MAKEKIAILGAGPSGLTTAYWLTSTPELCEQYDITIYQMGWRAGGKGRSGRGEDGRIEEHGLHILFGFYQNFFTMIRKVYDELDRPPDHPLATWRQAFQPHDNGVLEENLQGSWHPWMIEFPGNTAIPGQGGAAVNGSRDYLLMFIQGLAFLTLGGKVTDWFEERVFPRGERWVTAPDVVPDHSGKPDAAVEAAEFLVKELLRVAHVATDLRPVKLLLKSLRGIIWWAKGDLKKQGIAANRFWTGLDFFVSICMGIIEDRAFEPGALDEMDKYDFREWLQRHGAQKETLCSPYARIVYDAAFSYIHGRTREQKCAAGSSLRCFVRLIATYKGAAHYRMTSGMGDTVFAPLYLVLRKRGVKFQFFRKVEELKLSPERDRVESVRMTVQAEVKGGAEYQPLVPIKGLECWPNEPLYDQLVMQPGLRSADLESYYSDWPPKPGKEETIRVGEQFDHVVLATPIACIPYLCQDILSGKDSTATRWKDMVRDVGSVPTVALQLWFKKSLKDLGWTDPPPLLSIYVEPMNTWADMSQVLPTEDWPAGVAPGSVSYFCGPLPEENKPPMGPDPAYAVKMTEKAREISLEYIRHHLTKLLPGTAVPGHSRQFDWDSLLAPDDHVGEQRLEDQYYRSNIDPAERCSLALPGSTKSRMPAEGTGFSNLTVAGDWIANGIYLACMEGAIQGGIYGARAVAGVKFPIIGEDLLPSLVPSSVPRTPARARPAPTVVATPKDPDEAA